MKRLLTIGAALIVALASVACAQVRDPLANTRGSLCGFVIFSPSPPTSRFIQIHHE
jgi:hypothetical protein